VDTLMADKIIDLTARRNAKNCARDLTNAILPGASQKTKSIIMSALEVAMGVRMEKPTPKPDPFCKHCESMGVLQGTCGAEDCPAKEK
jgi:hypothetical protein